MVPGARSTVLSLSCSTDFLGAVRSPHRDATVLSGSSGDHAWCIGYAISIGRICWIPSVTNTSRLSVPGRAGNSHSSKRQTFSYDPGIDDANLGYDFYLLRGCYRSL